MKIARNDIGVLNKVFTMCFRSIHFMFDQSFMKIASINNKKLQWIQSLLTKRSYQLCFWFQCFDFLSVPKFKCTNIKFVRFSISVSNWFKETKMALETCLLRIHLRYDRHSFGIMRFFCKKIKFPLIVEKIMANKLFEKIH
jgi:hypothetical protein